MPAPTLRQLTGVFFRIGNTTFGGGLPTIAALQRELVEQHEWLSPRRLRASVFAGAHHPWHQCNRVLRGRRRAHPGPARRASRSPRRNRAVRGARRSHDARLRNLAHQRVGDGRCGRDYRRCRGHDVVEHLVPCATPLQNRATPFARSVITLGAFAAVWKFGLGPLPVIGIAAFGGRNVGEKPA